MSAFLRIPGSHLKVFADGVHKMDQHDPASDIDYSPLQLEKRYTLANQIYVKTSETSSIKADSVEEVSDKKSASAFFSGFEASCLSVLNWAITFFEDRRAKSDDRFEVDNNGLFKWCKQTFANLVAGAVKRALSQQVVESESDEIEEPPSLRTVTEIADLGDQEISRAPPFNLPENLPGLRGVATDLRFPALKGRTIVRHPGLPDLSTLRGRCAPTLHFPQNLPLSGIATA